MVIMNGYTAGDNQLHDSTIKPQQNYIAGTYSNYNENIYIFMWVIYKILLAHEIKCRYYLISHVFICNKNPLYGMA